MAEWRLPDEMIGRGENAMDNWRWSSSRAGDVFKAMVGACDVCEGSGKGAHHWGSNERLAKIGDLPRIDPCEKCHSTGLAGVEWHCVSDLHWDQCRSVRSWGLQGDIDDHADCRMRLIVDMERIER